MRRMIVRLPHAITVLPQVGGAITLLPGATVDLDAIVGETCSGAPLTLGDCLTSEQRKQFTAVPSAAEDRPTRGRRHAPAGPAPAEE